MHALSDDERNLLRHYAEGERVVIGLQRTPAHRHLLGIGYNQEQPMGEAKCAYCRDGCRSKSVA
jgi:hypothetical protein